MPALPRLRTPALAELAKGLRFQPPESARRQLVRAEAFALELLRDWASVKDQTFPLEYVVFRVTGLRGVEIRGEESEGTMIVGAALLADVPALVERLSSSAGVLEREVRGTHMRAVDLAASWNVSIKTLDRYRRQGLAARRARGSAGSMRETLWFSRASVAAFERVRADGLGTAKAFGRLTPGERERIVRLARAAHARFGWSLHECARRIAGKTGRSVAGVRGVLLANERTGGGVVFGESGALSARRVGSVARGLARGGSPSVLGRELGKGRTTIYKAAARDRLARLVAGELSGEGADGPVGSTFDRSEASEVLLGPAWVREGLSVPETPTVGAWLAAAAALPAPSKAIEEARAIAYWFLRWRAKRGIEVELARGGVGSGSPRMGVLDRVETDLRWAERLRVVLAWSQAGLAARTIESVLGVRADELPSATASRVVNLANGALLEAVNGFDPFRGGRLAAPASLELNRRLGEVARSLARSRPDRSGVARPDGSGGVLAPFGGVRVGRVAAGGGMGARLLALRSGEGGSRPMTLVEAAGVLGLTPVGAARLERRTLAEAGKEARR